MAFNIIRLFYTKITVRLTIMYRRIISSAKFGWSIKYVFEKVERM